MPVLARPHVVAVLLPVAPAVAWTYPSPAPARLQVLLAQRAVKTSVIEVGARSDFVEFEEKKPSTMSFFVVVVTDGATNEVLRRVNAPPCESTGEVVSMPLKSRIAPAADVCEPTDHTYAAGSEEVATL
jgi:hypothetical protein